MNRVNGLWEHCTKFFKDQRISCPETIFQSDRVMENSAEFIEGIGKLIGYYDEESDQFHMQD